MREHESRQAHRCWSSIAALIAAFFAFDLGRYFSLDYFKSQQAAIDALLRARIRCRRSPSTFCVYVAVTGLSLPGAAIMTLAGGAIFGLLWGTLIVSFASTHRRHAGLPRRALSVARLRSSAVRRQARAAINAGVEKDGAFYLFTLRLVPAFPFFVINLVMGLTPIRARTFYWVSQLGMLAGTIVYVNAGTELAQIDSLVGILSPDRWRLVSLLGVFPLAARRSLDAIKARRVYAQLAAAARFDRNLVVIGAGSAGLVSAYIAAAVKAKVTLIEKHRMGGDCLNTGCVPSKALIRSAKFVAESRRAREFGMRSASCRVRLRRGDGARAARHQDDRAARLGRALHAARRRMHRGRSDDHFAVDGRGQRRRR